MRILSLPRIAVFGSLISLSAPVTAQNAAPNPDFDSGTTGWSGGTFYQTDGSPSAPSYLVASPANNQHAASSDCFSLDNTKPYAFTGRLRSISGLGIMTLDVYQDSACTSFAGGGHIFLGNLDGGSSGSGNWKTVTYGPAFFPYSNVMSGKIQLDANTAFGYTANILFDHLVVEPVLFSDDFESH
jgi:hypothetical protein